jgi:hypothetical protein
MTTEILTAAEARAALGLPETSRGRERFRILLARARVGPARTVAAGPKGGHRNLYAAADIARLAANQSEIENVRRAG